MQKYNDRNLEAAFNSYFGNKEDEQVSNSEEIKEVSIPKYSELMMQSNTKVYKSNDLPTNSRVSQFAKDNVSSIDELGEKLRRLLNAAWGDDWGIIGPIFTKGENSENYVFPQVTYNTHSREVAEGSSPKPKLTEYIKEVINNEETGDAFAVYRQQFDCILEFDIWGRSTYEAHTKAEAFELLISNYSWFLKEAGVAEILFLKEVPPKESANYIEGLNMKPLLFYVRLERIQSIRVSELSEIKYKLQNNTVNNTDDLYKQSKIKYNLD